MKQARRQYAAFFAGLLCSVFFAILGTTVVFADTEIGSVTIGATVNSGSAAVCGDGTVAHGEACDDGNAINGDGCSSTCTIETNGVGASPVCGDGQVASGVETCDDRNTVSGDGCSSSCTLEPIICGNLVQQSGETCDDGNTSNGDGCSATCQREGVCGNSRMEPGETCDDGNTNNYDGCSATCFAELCGNGAINPGEQCDDGNHVGTDSCDQLCRINLCGNGTLNSQEFCDDGNTINGDGCSNTCQTETPSCQTQYQQWSTRLGYLQSLELKYLRGELVDQQQAGCVSYPGPECDEYRYTSRIASDPSLPTTNVNYQDLATFSLFLTQVRVSYPKCFTFDVNVPRCGDGKVDLGEECDWRESRFIGVGGCSSMCNLIIRPSTPPVSGCGNFIVEQLLGEQCDDGNRVPFDGCSTFCEREVIECGNGLRETGEQCDDGNKTNGDDCSATCQVEAPVDCSVAWTDFVARGRYVSSLIGRASGFVGEVCSTMPAAQCDQFAYNNRDSLQLNTLAGAFKFGSYATFTEFQQTILAKRSIFTPAYCVTFGANVCGNGRVDGSRETCDDGNRASGDGCSSVCTLEENICGNGILEGAELCDDGNTNNADGCSSRCDFLEPVCGNGISETGEACDDGNTNNGDDCSSVCLMASCGNGVIDSAEECDDGNADGADSCDLLCRANLCGNRVINLNESCDDGNRFNGDGCSNTCQSESNTCDVQWRNFNSQLSYWDNLQLQALRGQSIAETQTTCLNPPGSECDSYRYTSFLSHPSNAVYINNPAYPQYQSISTFSVYMNNLRRTHFPKCYAIYKTAAQCGNGQIETGEQCDDRNLLNGDGCSATCQLVGVCGNGVQDIGEQCDDGNQNGQIIDGHICSAGTCQLLVDNPMEQGECGNSILEIGEQCEDGNTTDGDGCSSVCQLEEEVPSASCLLGIEEDCPNPVDRVLDALEKQLDDVNLIELLETLPGGDLLRELLESGATREQIFSLLNQLDPSGEWLEQSARVFGLGNTLLHSSVGAIANGIGSIQESANNPAVERTVKNVIVPAAIGTSLVTVAPSLVSVTLPLLRYLFLQPLLFVGKRKRQQWGQIYDSYTRLPVDLALVRLIDVKQNRVIQSRVTDAQGRYVFIVEPGEYQLEVVKQGYTFPTQLLKGIKSDGRLLDIYHGEKVVVTQDSVVMTPNVPLDPQGVTKTLKRITWEKWLRSGQHLVAVAGIVSTSVSLYINPTLLIGFFLLLHTALYGLFTRYVQPKKPKGWGIVYDNVSKQPIGQVVARLFTKQYNKLVSVQITDPKGRYAFLAGPNQYYVTFEKPGYTESLLERNIEEDQSQGFINDDIELKKQEMPPQVSPVTTPAQPSNMPPQTLTVNNSEPPKK